MKQNISHRILGILGLFGILFTACDNNSPSMKNFKTKFGDITAITADVTVYPTDNVNNYYFWSERKSFVDVVPVEDYVALTKMVIPDSYRGDAHEVLENLFPATEHVLMAVPVTADLKLDGTIEYVKFKTPDWSKIIENGLQVEKEGVVTEHEDELGKYIEVSCGDETNGMKLLLRSSKPTGNFTQKDLWYWPGEEGSRFISEGKSYPIYKVEVAGIYEGNVKKYVYTGSWTANYVDEKCGKKTQFKISCDLK